jgi:hypothetical protein
VPHTADQNQTTDRLTSRDPSLDLDALERGWTQALACYRDAHGRRDGDAPAWEALLVASGYGWPATPKEDATHADQNQSTEALTAVFRVKEIRDHMTLEYEVTVPVPPADPATTPARFDGGYITEVGDDGVRRVTGTYGPGGQSREEREGRIAAAAVRMEDGTLYSLPPPARHHDVMHHFKVMATPDQQGFITSTGLWARRKPALRIAQRNGQLIREPTAPAHGLFSEDVW